MVSIEPTAGTGAYFVVEHLLERAQAVSVIEARLVRSVQVDTATAACTQVFSVRSGASSLQHCTPITFPN